MNGPLDHVLCFLRRKVRPTSVRGATDVELLHRFVEQRDEAAFALLVKAHGPMVLSVCRRVLGNVPDAEDAFQAVFLVLVRKARSLARRELLANWLYGVAYRTAQNARRHRAKRAQKERPLPDEGPAAPSSPGDLPDLGSVLHEEVERLPRRYRAPLVLCYLEGKSYEEASGDLRCPKGTVATRLARAKTLLHRRLTRRGVTISAAALAALLGADAAAAPNPLVTSTVAAAAKTLTGKLTAGGPISVRTVELTRGVLHTMFLAQVKLAAALVLTVSVASVGAGVLAYQALVPAKHADTTSAPAPRAASSEGREARLDRYGDPLPAGAILRLGTVHFRHSAEVSGIALSPNGTLLASAGLDGTVRLWTFPEGREIWRTHGDKPDSPFYAVVFSPDGKRLAGGGDGKIIYVWDVASHETLLRLGGHQGPIRCMAFSPDGSRLASGCGSWHWGSDDRAIRVWDAATGNEILQLRGHQRGVRSLAFAPDGKTLASAGGAWEEEMRNNQTPDPHVLLWDLETGKERRALAGHERGARAVAFSPHGKLLATGDQRIVRLWDPATGKEVRQLKAPKDQGVESLAFSRDGDILVSGGTDGALREWDVATGKQIRQAAERQQIWMRSVAITADSKFLISAGAEARVRVWDAATGEEVPKIQEHQSALHAVAFSPDGRFLATASRDTTLRLWDAVTGQELRVFRGHEHYVDSAVFSPDGKYLASTGYMDYSVRLWDVATGKQLLKLPPAREGRFFSVAFTPDGTTLAAGSEWGTVRRWEVPAAKELPPIKLGGDCWIRSLAYSSDGARLAIAAGDRIHVWDAASKALLQLPVPQGSADYIALSPDGRSAVSAGGARAVYLWELASGKARWQSESNDKHYTAVAFAPDGRCVASAGSDQNVRLWDAITGKELHVFRGHAARIMGLSFAPDGRRLASASEDHTAIVWDMIAYLPQRTSGERLSAAELERLWTELASEDAVRAYQAMGKLRSAPEQAIAFLKAHLRSPTPPSDEQIAGWINALNSEQFAERERATGSLAKLGSAAETALRKALDAKPAPEARRRIERLLERLLGTPPERLRPLRSLEVLEGLGTATARVTLEQIAGVAPEEWLVCEARSSLQRLTRRKEMVLNTSSPRP